MDNDSYESPAVIDSLDALEVLGDASGDGTHIVGGGSPLPIAISV